MTKITVLGVGPGDPDLLTIKAMNVLQLADVVAGFETVLGPVRQWIKGEVMPMRYRDQEDVLDHVAEQAGKGKQCVVCAWGDLNFSARELVERVRRRADEIELIPGISSVQVACSRLGLAMEESLFITLHAREGYKEGLQEAVEAIGAGRRNVIMLPRPYDIMPADIAGMMLEQGLDASIKAYVMQRLSLDNEIMKEFDLKSLAQTSEEFSDLSILVFPRKG